MALEELWAQEQRVGAAGLVAVDLGTGSGAIALSLACEFRPDASFEVWATDLSADALDVCRQNLDALARRSPASAAVVRVAEGSWFTALPDALAGHIRLVVANPPYVSLHEWKTPEPVVRDHEPFAALVPGPNGFEAIDAIQIEAPVASASAGASSSSWHHRRPPRRSIAPPPWGTWTARCESTSPDAGVLVARSPGR